MTASFPRIHSELRRPRGRTKPGRYRSSAIQEPVVILSYRTNRLADNDDLSKAALIEYKLNSNQRQGKRYISTLAVGDTLSTRGNARQPNWIVTMLPRYAVKVVAHTHTEKLSKEPAVLSSPTGYCQLSMLDAGFHKVPHMHLCEQYTCFKHICSWKLLPRTIAMANNHQILALELGPDLLKGDTAQ